MKWIYWFVLSLVLSACFLNGQKSSDKKEELVILQTNYGDMKLKLYNQTPIHKANFLNLVDSGFYDGLLFHRVISKFMIQGGDPDSRTAKPNQNLGNGGPGYTLEAEINDSLIHKRGALAAARLGDDANPEKRSSGSQFYIVQGRAFTSGDLKRVQENHYHQTKVGELQKYLYEPENEKILKRLQYCQGARMVVEYDSILRSLDPILEQRMDPDARKEFTEQQIEAYTTIGGAPHLDGGYTVFGEVVEGLNVIDSICAVRKNANDRPLRDVIILKATRVKK